MALDLLVRLSVQFCTRRVAVGRNYAADCNYCMQAHLHDCTVYFTVNNFASGGCSWLMVIIDWFVFYLMCFLLFFHNFIFYVSIRSN